MLVYRRVYISKFQGYGYNRKSENFPFFGWQNVGNFGVGSGTRLDAIDFLMNAITVV